MTTAKPPVAELSAPDPEAVLIELTEALRRVRRGDLKVRLPRRPGRAGEVADAFNDVVSLQERQHHDLRRISRIVGQDGRLNERLDGEGLDGSWAEGQRAVNSLIDDLGRPTIEIARVIVAVAEGDLSQHMALKLDDRPLRGEYLGIGRRVNTMVDQLSSFADEVTRVAREVGTEGKLGGQADVRGAAGTWKDLIDSVNTMGSNLTAQVRNISQVSTAVATGDLGQKITVDAQGEILELKNTVNTMVDQLSSFADEVTRVAREVGTEGKLGGQAQVKGVSGTWRDLTDNVNSMASNLTSQVRNIASVTTAVARGDLGQKITVDAQGEILELKNTVNTMVDQLSSFADEVTRVAREVGTEGKLGGQAQVRGVAGTWRDLTENVNQLASTLTVQLRTIAQVSTSVTRGDLTQRIAVEAQGEVAELTDNINQMIVTLRETTEENAEQGWLDSNLARIGGLLQGQRDLGEVCRMIMTEVTPLVDAQLGAFFLVDDSEGSFRLRLAASYGYVARGQDVTFGPGEGLVGQTALSRRTIRVSGGPDNPLRLRSGLADTAPADLVVLPVIFEGELLGVIEFASMTALSDLYLSFLERLVLTIGVAVNTIQANRRTEELLSQSQRLAHELQEQSAELQRTNAELEEKAKLLSEQKGNIETKNREVELARLGLEETAQQLTRASAYKSEFLANMSHELRTPLNSLLLLARLLVENPEQNLSPKQIEFARTIHSAGTDLLSLIDDILDLSKIEAGRMDVEPTGIRFTEIRSYVEQAFVPQAQEKGLDLEVRVSPDLPEKIVTDAQRLQQILRNLISNAVKFTDAGVVRLAIAPAPESTVFDVPALTNARQVIAFTVADTGIGISDDKLSIIFEAFQQADGTTSRRYGGTGLGLSISRDLARLLGGAIGVSSAPGQGSTFTLFVPDVLAPDAVVGPAPPSPARAGLPSSLLMPSVELLPTAAEAAATRQLAGATVLIVDDDVRTVFALTSALELHGMTVLYADNGADGVRLLAEHPEADIVLMDAMIPDQDGYETTRQIRRNHRFADLPIVFLTAKAMPGDRESALAAGGSDYITKPVDLDELIELMTTWISGGRSEEGL
ncbi:HAMP domain-containing protein [Salinispora arenicola]|nr:HAMP domain-containing protein [Salinispora arenicola]NIL41476.1 HAMP domain-containing protein [Salinispora arenicola]